MEPAARCPYIVSNGGTNASYRYRHGSRFAHERWAARRALQLVLPQDDLYAIAVEGLSTREESKAATVIEEIADLALYYGNAADFKKCRRLEIVKFKYSASEAEVPATSSYLKRTVEKFSASLAHYIGETDADTARDKLEFVFVTNRPPSADLIEAIQCLVSGTDPASRGAESQKANLQKWCKAKGSSAESLFKHLTLRASTKGLPAQNSALRQTVTDWSVGNDLRAKERLFEITQLVRDKAGSKGQRNNLIVREDILNALGLSDESDLFPARANFPQLGLSLGGSS